MGNVQMQPDEQLLKQGAIATISRDKHGRNESVPKLTTAQGQEYRLLPDRFDEWLQALGDALAAHHAIKLVEREPGTWTAERG